MYTWRPYHTKFSNSFELCLTRFYLSIIFAESWRTDEDKCTFIILDRSMPSDPPGTGPHAMAGDVNLFINDPEEHSTAEIEVCRHAP